MMQSLVLMTERNPEGTTTPYPSLSPDRHHLPQLSLAPTATLIDNEPKGVAIITAGRLATSPSFNSFFSGFIRPHLPGAESGICLPLPLLPLDLLGVLCWCLLARWPVTLRGEDAPSRKTLSVCSVTESRRERKDFFFFSSSLLSFVHSFRVTAALLAHCVPREKQPQTSVQML